MPDLIRRTLRRPLALAAMLWPLVLLAPFVPGLPRPSPSGFTWRQELSLALLLCVTFALLAGGARPSYAPNAARDRTQLFLKASLLLFTLWSAASAFWAANPYPALHHAVTWGEYLLFFILLLKVAERPRALYGATTALAVVVLIISISSVVGSLSTHHSLFRNNGLGEPLALVVPLFAALALWLRGRRSAVLCGATAALSWLAMLQMFERTLFIATTVALCLLALIAVALPKWRPRRPLRAALLLTVFVALTILQSIPSPFVAREDETQIAPTVIGRLSTTTTDDLNTRARFLFWGAAFEMLRARPLTGVGANNYDVAFADARARFSARNPDSPLVVINEGFLAVRAHNEYLQILAELGAVGFLLFLLFSAALVWAAVCALRRARSPLVPGAVGSLAAFALSSGASSVSFRWMGSGLIFFFAAAIVSRFALARTPPGEQYVRIKSLNRPAPLFTRRAWAAAFVFSLVMLGAMGAQMMNVLMNGAAQATADTAEAERRFRSALFWNPYDAAAHFNYGMRLLSAGRAAEAAPHLRFAVENGINTSVCYVYLASAEAGAGDAAGAERTLARAIEVYPRSVFLRVRHAAALFGLGQAEGAREEYAKAISINSGDARAWRELICFGKKAASDAARRDASVTLPGDLLPGDAVLFVIAENEKRPPTGCSSGLHELSASAISTP